MKNNIMRYAALFIIVSLFASATLPALAHLEPDLNSYWAYNTPTINGTMAPGEWTDAAVRSFTLDMRSRLDGSHSKNLNAKLLVKNDYNNLYILVQIYNDTYWATDFANRWKGLAVLFDGNHNGVLDQGENGEGITTWTGSPFYAKNDLYYDAVGGLWDADVNAGKTNDGAIAFTHTNPVNGQLGNWTYEMSIPLVGSDIGYDFNIQKAQLPKTIGFKIWFFDQNKGLDGVYPDDPAVNTNLDETFNAATFGNLIIHPLYYLTIQSTAGGTTNPLPGVYPYGYGTVVSVTALPNGGFYLNHWELDSVNVGSVNPYMVTMNQNHTILSVFQKILPVGGFSLRPAASSSLAYYGIVLAVLGAAISVIKRRKH